jgi:hypothetical protein
MAKKATRFPAKEGVSVIVNGLEEWRGRGDTSKTGKSGYCEFPYP